MKTPYANQGRSRLAGATPSTESTMSASGATFARLDDPGAKAGLGVVDAPNRWSTKPSRWLRNGRVGCLLGLLVGLNDGFIAGIGGGGSPRAQILEFFDFLLSEMLDANEHVLRALARMSSSSFRWMAWASRFCVFWMRNTIRNVTIVVPVLMTSCHVSENPNKGPLAAQTTTIAQLAMKVRGEPAPRATPLEAAVNIWDRFIGLFTVRGGESIYTRSHLMRTRIFRVARRS